MFGIPRGLPAFLTATAVLCGLLLSPGPSSPMPGGTLALDAPPGWTDVSPSGSPPAMAGAMMAYSSRAHRFVLFGGWDGVAGLNGTWVYDPGNRTWNALHPNVSPLGRGDAMFVYDNRSDNFILFGGWHELANQTYVRLSDTWVFSLETATWTERHPPVSPAPRSDSEVAYDPPLGLVFLATGFGKIILNDLWGFKLASDTWVNLTPALSPPPRFAATGGFDLMDNVLVVFSGLASTGLLADTWHYTYGPSVAPTVLWPIAGVGVASTVVAGVALAIAFRLSRRRRSGRLP